MKCNKKLFLLAGTALISCVLLCGCGSNEDPGTTQPSVTIPATTAPSSIPAETDPVLKSDLPWDNGGKQPLDYTWEEFEALSDEHKAAFQAALGNVEFEIWKEWSQRPPMPWENEGAKRPEEYSWQEFEELSPEEQIEFQNALGFDAFAAWMEQAQYHTGTAPWDEPGAKQPEEYTWEEFEELSPEHQIQFQNVMGTEAFEAWMEEAQNQPLECPWDVPGAKQPEEYTWEEFEALAPEHQIQFQFAMGLDAFAVWMEKVNP